MSRIKFGILGGDLRYKILFNLLKNDGYNVSAFCNNCIECSKNGYDDLFDGTDVIIAPIPFSKDNKKIFLKDCANIKITELFEKMNKHSIKTLIGGVMTDEIRELGLKYGIRIFDFFDKESVAVLNAIPTAEGAIQTAMTESDRTIFMSKCLVLGYGRCGKILANSLKGLGADVSVTYRNEKDEAYIKAFGFKEINLYDVIGSVESFDFIFNTIPAHVINKKFLRKVNKDCIIIDLAQAPGGVDFNYAREEGIKALYCPGLPGRVAPVTAAEVLKTAVLKISVSQITSL